MQEVLFIEPANHYLLSSDMLHETILVTVSPSEVNVMIRYVKPGESVEANIIAQSTTIDGTNFTVLLKQLNRASDWDDNGETTPQDLTKSFLERLDMNLELVEARRISDGGTTAPALTFLRKGVVDFLNQSQ